MTHRKSKKRKYFVVWLTGLPCSGKTTLAKKIKKRLEKKGFSVQHLDGDSIRKSVNKNLNFSKSDRNENVKRVAHIASSLLKKGNIVIVSLVSPYKNSRNTARKICKNFYEIYIACSLKECIRRDSKGWYKKALGGKVKNFTGISDPYEEPKNPELTLDTEKYSSESNVNKVIKFLETNL